MAKNMVWSEIEWYEVVREAINIRLREGCGWDKAAIAAQKRVLDQSRWRKDTSLGGGALTNIAKVAARIQAGWVPEGASPPLPPPPIPAKKRAAPPAKEPAHSVRWTEREWAMLACAVKHRIEQGDRRALSRLFFETQADVLPADRRRPLAPLYVTNLRERYEAALPNVWTLPAELQAKLTGREAEYAAHLEKTREGLAVLEAVKPAAAEAPAEAPEPAPEPTPAPEPVPEPSPVPNEPPSADPLAARIALILSQAAAQISAATRAHVMAEYDRQLDRLVVALAASLREHVHNLLEAELGAGPVMKASAPPPSPSAPPTQDEPQSPAGTEGTTPVAQSRPRVKVDVVGLSGNTLGEVRAAAERAGLDVAFIDAQHGRSWHPRENVILATRFISHNTQERAKRAHSNIMFANAGAQSVIGILESLAQHEGALQ